MIGNESTVKEKDKISLIINPILFSVESCYLANMGWLDLEAEDFNKEVIQGDLATLPAQITANISDESVGTCAEEALEAYGNHP